MKIPSIKKKKFEDSFYKKKSLSCNFLIAVTTNNKYKHVKYLEMKVNVMWFLLIIYHFNILLLSNAPAFVHAVSMRKFFRGFSCFTLACQCSVKIVLAAFGPKADLENHWIWLLLPVIQVTNWPAVTAKIPDPFQPNPVCGSVSSSLLAESCFPLCGLFNINNKIEVVLQLFLQWEHFIWILPLWLHITYRNYIFFFFNSVLFS